MQHISFRRFYQHIKSVFKHSKKATIVSVVFLVAFTTAFVSVSAQTRPTTIFTNDGTSGISNVSSNNWTTGGTDVFNIIASWKFTDGQTNQNWNKIYQRVEGWTTSLYYGPRESAGTFIVRTYKASDKQGTPVEDRDSDGNPKDTKITIVPQMVEYDHTPAVDNNNPSQVLDTFYKYQSQSSQRVGIGENLKTTVETATIAKPGELVAIDFWYCPLENYTGDSVRPAGAENSPYRDNTPGDVNTRDPDGINILRSSPTLFPDQWDEGNIYPLSSYIRGFGDRIVAPPCTNFMSSNGTHSKQTTVMNGSDDAPFDKIKAGSYFKIGETVVYEVAKDATVNATEQEKADEAPAVNAFAREENFLPSCGVFSNESSIMGCVAQGIYYVIYVPIQWFAALLGNLFDFFLGYSLDDASYRAAFAVKGWKIVRDISNVFFILILVWTGLETVFKTSSNSMKKVVPTLILNALLINFSLFGTRVIIDISNIVTRVFYTSMTVCKGACEKDADGNIKNPADTVGTYTPLSEKIVSAYNPQKLFGSKTLDQAKAVKNTNAYSGNVGSATNSKDGDVTRTTFDAGTTAGYFIIVELIAAAILFGIAMMFWKVAFMFLGRVVGLYITMIFAPFAVLTRGGMPLVGGIKELSWDNWLKDLTNYALLAPIFVFFLYIIYSFIQSGFLENLFPQDVANQNFFTTVISIAVPMLILYFMIKQGADIAKKYAGTIGNKIQEYAQKTVGVAGGVALGATAIAGGRVIGGLAKKFDESSMGGRVRDMAAKGGIAGLFGKTIQKGVNATRSGSFDVRQTGIGKGLFKQMGIDTDSKELGMINKTLNFATLGATTGLGLSTAERKGGLDADIKRRQEEREKEAKLLEEKMTDEQAKKFNERRQKKYEDKIERIVEEAMMEKTGKSRPALRDLKKNDPNTYDLMKTQTLRDPVLKAKVDKETAEVKKPADVKTAADLTSERRKDFAENLKKGGYLTQGLEALAKTGALGEFTAGLIGSTVGAAIGSQVRTSGDRKAAKKLEEKNKIDKELADIENTLKKGFQDLIALDMFQSSASFTSLSPTEKQEIIKDGVIQSGPRKGQSMYDILTDVEKTTVDADVKQKKDAMTQGTEAQKKKAKEEYEEYEDLVKAREGNKYDMKGLRKELKDAQNDWLANPGDQPLKDLFRQKLKEVKNAEKQQAKWRDVNSYIKTRRDKLKEDDK